MARHSNGWIKFYRSAAEGDLVQNPILYALWSWLLATATWKPTSVIWNGKRRDIPPGTVVFGISNLADQWGCSKSTLSKWLRYLEESGRISLETRTRGSLVTIRNWSEYQATEDEARTPGEHGANTGRTPTERQVTLSKESKKGRREEPPKPPEKNPGELARGLEICLYALQGTLEHFGIEKDPRSDSFALSRLIKEHSTEQVRLALIGARFEAKTKTFDPREHFSLERIGRPQNFQKLVNLGAQQKEAPRFTTAQSDAAIEATRRQIAAGAAG